MGLQRALDLLHERLVLKDVKRLLLPFPILGADDDEVLSPTPPDTERDMVLHHLLDRVSKVASEIVDGYLSHGGSVPETGTMEVAEATRATRALTE